MQNAEWGSVANNLTNREINAAAPRALPTLFFQADAPGIITYIGHSLTLHSSSICAHVARTTHFAHPAYLINSKVRAAHRPLRLLQPPKYPPARLRTA